MLDDHREKAVAAIGDFGCRASLPSASLRRYFSRGTGSSNPSPSSRQSVSLPPPLLKVENPAFRAGLGSWLADRVSRDSLGVSISRQPAAISLSGDIPVPRCGWSWRRALRAVDGE